LRNTLFNVSSAEIVSPYFWTGIKTENGYFWDGLTYKPPNCDQWTKTGVFSGSYVGSVYHQTYEWYRHDSALCGDSYPVLCLRVYERIPRPTTTPTIPTLSPTFKPTVPTNLPTINPTINPTLPTSSPTLSPSNNPTISPSLSPTPPTDAPTTNPTTNPTEPTMSPTKNPTKNPTTSKPTKSPVVNTIFRGNHTVMFISTNDYPADFAYGGDYIEGISHGMNNIKNDCANTEIPGYNENNYEVKYNDVFLSDRFTFYYLPDRRMPSEYKYYPVYGATSEYPIVNDVSPYQYLTCNNNYNDPTYVTRCSTLFVPPSYSWGSSSGVKYLNTSLIDVAMLPTSVVANYVWTGVEHNGGSQDRLITYDNSCSYFQSNSLSLTAAVGDLHSHAGKEWYHASVRQPCNIRLPVLCIRVYHSKY